MTVHIIPTGLYTLYQQDYTYHINRTVHITNRIIQHEAGCLASCTTAQAGPGSALGIGEHPAAQNGQKLTVPCLST